MQPGQAQLKSGNQPLSKHTPPISRNSQGVKPTTVPRATPSPITSQGQQRGQGLKPAREMPPPSDGTAGAWVAGLWATGLGEAKWVLSGMAKPGDWNSVLAKGLARGSG